MRDRRIGFVAAASFATVLVLKMVLLEPLILSGLGLTITVVAALLPLALLLGLPGVLVITAACGLAHWVNDGGVSDALIAASAVAVATAGAYLILRRGTDVLRWITAGWLLTALFVAVMALGLLLVFGQEPVEALSTIFFRVWVAINLIGVPAAILGGYLARGYIRSHPIPATEPRGGAP